MIGGLVIAILSLSAIVSAEEPATFFQPVNPPRCIQSIAMGGMSRQAPTHSRPAIERAIADGVEWVAVFVRKTKDGTRIVISQEASDEWMKAKGKPIGESTFDEVKTFPIGQSFGKRFTSERIMTLDETLQAAKGRINLVLVVGMNETDPLLKIVNDAGLAAQVAVIENHGLEPWPNTAKEYYRSLCKGAFNVKTGVSSGLPVRNTAEDFDRLVHKPSGMILTVYPEVIIARQTVRLLNDKNFKRPKISHHRGAGRYVPENTFFALEESLLLQADFIEFDIRPSSDGEYFVIHDSKLDRTTNGKGPINEMTAAEIKKLDAGSWFGKPYEGAKVPTLDEFLSKVGDTIELYVDAKDIPPEKLVEALKRHKLIERSVVYQHPGYLARLREIEPSLRRMPPLGNANDIDALIKEVAPYAFDTSWKILTKELVDRCHERGVQVFSDALGLYERPSEYQKAARIGVDVIQTDQPLRVLQAFREIVVTN